MERDVASLSRILAMLLLPLSIAPVLALGPSVARAPVTLAREGWGEVQRLELYLEPGHSPRPHAPALAPGPSIWQPSVSLGAVYGRWSGLPQTGRTGITWTGPR
jgi:hypothetical protein